MSVRGPKPAKHGRDHNPGGEDPVGLPEFATALFSGTSIPASSFTDIPVDATSLVTNGLGWRAVGGMIECNRGGFFQCFAGVNSATNFTGALQIMCEIYTSTGVLFGTYTQLWQSSLTKEADGRTASNRWRTQALVLNGALPVGYTIRFKGRFGDFSGLSGSVAGGALTVVRLSGATSQVTAEN